MPEKDGSAEYWKRISGVLAALLAFAVMTIGVLVAVLTWKAKAHEVALSALRTRFERERDTLTKMWQVSDEALRRERKEAVLKADDSRPVSGAK